MRFWQCPECEFLCKDPSHHLSAIDEKARYDTHNNGDEGHRKFLSPVVDYIVENFSQPDSVRGLDWGSGPVPVLAEELRFRGFTVETYDPFYQPQKPDLSLRFDFITLTEVIEHAFDPAALIEELKSRLANHGKILVMTEQPPSREELGRWWYRRDTTHISFFSEKCLRSFEKIFGLKLAEKSGRIFVFTKSEPS